MPHYLSTALLYISHTALQIPEMAENVLIQKWFIILSTPNLAIHLYNQGAYYTLFLKTFYIALCGGDNLYNKLRQGELTAQGTNENIWEKMFKGTLRFNILCSHRIWNVK